MSEDTDVTFFLKGDNRNRTNRDMLVGLRLVPFQIFLSERANDPDYFLLLSAKGYSKRVKRRNDTSERIILSRGASYLNLSLVYVLPSPCQYVLIFADSFTHLF